VSATDDALERRILELLATGDRAGAATVATRGYGPQILGYLQAVLRSADEGVAAFSLFCQKAWFSIGQQRSTIKAWAYSLAWQVALRFADGSQPALESTPAERLAREVCSLTAPHLRTASRDRVGALQAALDPAEQTLLILRIDRGLSWREIGEVLADGGEEVSEPELRKRFERVKARLRQLATERHLL
jgi:RNA polymerase sigma-70 factor (ECF subfamily)